MLTTTDRDLLRHLQRQNPSLERLAYQAEHYSAPEARAALRELGRRALDAERPQWDGRAVLRLLKWAEGA